MFRRAFLLALICALTVSGVASAHWPVASRSSYVTLRFGVHFAGHHHYGLDIAARCGTPVVAPAAGRVVFAGWRSNGGGWQVIVRYTPTQFYALHHLQRRPLVHAGQMVVIGTRLGRIGSTGYSTGCHTHVIRSIGYPGRPGAVYLNPWTFVAHGPYLPWRYR